MSKKPSAVAVAVTACRKTLHLTQAEFAEWSGFSTATIVRWENGMRSPRAAQRHLFVHRVAAKRPDLAGPLAKVFDVDLLAHADTRPVPVAIDPRDLLVSVYRAAEKLEMPAAPFRAALAELVSEWSAAKWDTATIARALRATAEQAPVTA